MSDHAYAAVLSRLERLRPGGRPGQWRACCPVHGDRHPSLSVWVSRTGDLMARCKSRGCPFADIAAALGTTAADWKPPRDGLRLPPLRRRRVKIDQVYDYEDAAGTTLFQVVRATAAPGTAKQFFQRRPHPDKADAWLWGLHKGTYAPAGPGSPNWRSCPPDAPSAREFGEVKPVLYRLPLLLSTDASLAKQPVVVVEGEKDVATLEYAGFLATTCPGGAGKWRPEFTPVLAGRRVAVIADNDPAGWSHAGHVAGSLAAAGCPSVRIVWLTNAPKCDITDWLELHFHPRPLADVPAAEQRERAAHLLRRSPEWTPRLYDFRTARPANPGEAA